MSGGLGIQALGWIKIAPPVLDIDTAQGISNPNIRCDSGAISIWDRNGENPRQWQYWRGIAGGWSPLFTFPDDYAGGVGWLFDVDVNPSNPSFYTSEWLPASGSDVPSSRFCQIKADGTEFGNDVWWPSLAFLDSSNNPGIGLGGGFSPFPLAGAFFTQDPFDPNASLSFVSLADRNHIWVPMSSVVDPAIESALVGFTPNNGLADSVVFVDITLQNFYQNFTRPMFLYDDSGGLVDALSFHPSGANVYGENHWNAPVSSFQAQVLDIGGFTFGGGSITGPFIVGGDAANDYTPIYAPPITPTELRMTAENFDQTAYFPNSGIPGWAWQAVAPLTGAQAQQFAICHFDPIANPGGVHDDKAVVSPYRFSGAGPPDVLGIVYTPFAQGFQGLPFPVAFPADAVPPFYGMVWQGGVYLIDSHSPTQMFALAFTTVQFAGLYALVNYVKMG